MSAPPPDDPIEVVKKLRQELNQAKKTIHDQNLKIQEYAASKEKLEKTVARMTRQAARRQRRHETKMEDMKRKMEELRREIQQIETHCNDMLAAYREEWH